MVIVGFFLLVSGVLTAGFHPEKVAATIRNANGGTRAPTGLGKVADLLTSYRYWKDIVSTRPDYRDGYLMLAYYAKELGNSDEAAGYLEKVRSIDPNYQFPEILEVEK